MPWHDQTMRPVSEFALSDGANSYMQCEIEKWKSQRNLRILTRCIRSIREAIQIHISSCNTEITNANGIVTVTIAANGRIWIEFPERYGDPQSNAKISKWYCKDSKRSFHKMLHVLWRHSRYERAIVVIIRSEISIMCIGIQYRLTMLTW